MTIWLGSSLVGLDPVHRLLLLLGAVGCAAALPFTGILAFAPVIARLAAAFALTRVFAFAGVLFLLVGIHRSRKLAGLRGKCRVGAARRRSGVQACHRAAEQAGEGRCEHQGVLANLHVYFHLLVLKFVDLNLLT